MATGGGWWRPVGSFFMVVAGGGEWWRVVAGGGGWWSLLLGAKLEDYGVPMIYWSLLRTIQMGHLISVCNFREFKHKN